MSSRSTRDAARGKGKGKGTARGASAAVRNAAAKARTRSSGPIVFFIALFIVALGSIQLLSTFYTYAIDLSELNGLKRQEAALEAKKQELENDIARWDDKAYVAAQARERLGFVFPGEQVVPVLHPEAVTGKTESGDTSGAGGSDKKALPWYSELAYSLEKADRKEADTSRNGTISGDSGTASGGTGTNTGTDGNANTNTNTNTDTNTNTEDSQQ